MESLQEYEVGEELPEVLDAAEQQMQEWLALRSGKLTCSRFGDLMSSGRAKDATFSQTGYSYLRQIVAERLGSYTLIASASSLSWGHDNEAAAVQAYTELTGREVDYDSHRFVKLTEWIGGSPDGLVGDDRCLEIKCPYNPAQHVETLISKQIPDQYVWQCVGHCFVTRRPLCDFVSFDPRIEGPNRIVLIEFQPSTAQMQFLSNRLAEAAGWVSQVLKKLKAS